MRIYCFGINLIFVTVIIFLKMVAVMFVLSQLSHVDETTRMTAGLVASPCECFIRSKTQSGVELLSRGRANWIPISSFMMGAARKNSELTRKILLNS